MHFYYNLSQNVFPKYNVFVKIFTFVTTPLKFSEYCDFFLNKKFKLNASMNGFWRKIFDLWKKWCN